MVAIAFLLPVFAGTGLVAVRSYEKNPFEEFDALRERRIEESLDEWRAAATRPLALPSAEAFSEGHIVKFRDDCSLSEIYEAVNGRSFMLLSSSEDRTFLIDLDDEPAFSDKYKDIIEYAERDCVRRTQSVTPDDPLVPGQWELTETGAFDAWEYGTGEGVIVAVLDSGLNRGHEDLDGSRILAGYDTITQRPLVETDSVGHGTKVTGIIAASLDNALGVAGIAPGVTVYPVRVTQDGKTINTSNIVYALYLAVDAGADVINMSLGGYAHSTAEEDAVNNAYENGCILVAASGNEGNIPGYSGSYSYPASYDHVISVGAYGMDGQVCGFSQHNDRVDVVAPGENLTLLDASGGYTTDSGTSFSCAFVSAAAALAVSVQTDGKRLNCDEFEKLLEYTGSSQKNNYYGFGKLDIPALLAVSNGPIALGVSDGGMYFESVRITFFRGTATLDGERISSGHTVYKSGEHTLIISEAGIERTVSFTVDTAKLEYEYTEYDTYAVITFSRGTATLDGFPYISGDRITTDGRHVFVLTGPNGNEREYVFDTGFSLPDAIGVSQGSVYTRPVLIRIAGRGRVMLDGAEITGDTVVRTDGEHTVTLISPNGKNSKTVVFTVSAGINAYDLGYAGINSFIDDEYNVFIAYMDGVSSLRLYDAADLSQIRRSLFLPSPVVSCALDGNYLYVFHEGSYTVYDRSKLLTREEPKLGTYQLSTGVTDGCVVNGKIYYLSAGRLYSADPMSGGGSMLAEMSGDVDCMFADIGGVIYMCDSSGAKSHVYTYDTANGTPGGIDLALAASGEILAADGRIFMNGAVFDSSGNCILLNSEKKPLWTDGRYVIYENSVVRVSDNRVIGVYGKTLRSVHKCSDGAVFLVFEDGTAETFVCSGDGTQAKDHGAAHYLQQITGESAQTNHYTYTGWTAAGKRPVSLAVDEANETAYLICGDDTLLYSLRFDSLKSDSAVSLRYLPTAVKSFYGGVYVSFAGVRYIYEAVSGRYISVPVKTDDFIIDGSGRVYAISGGRACTFVLGGDSIEYIGNSTAVRLALTDDSVCVYTGTELVSYDINGYAERARISASCSTPLVSYGAYVACGRKVYRSLDLAEEFACPSEIYEWSGNAVICGDGLYSVSDKKMAARYPLEASITAFTGRQDFCEISGGHIVVIRNLFDTEIIYPPVVTSPAEDGQLFHDGMTVVFTGGMGYLDGADVLSGAAVTEGGMHTLTVVGAWGITETVTFGVMPSLDRITLTGGNKSIGQGGSITLKVNFLPDGAPSQRVIFSSDSPCVSVSPDGTVTGVSPGRATVRAITVDGAFSASCYIIVSENLLAPSAGYTVDRNTETVTAPDMPLDVQMLSEAFASSNGEVIVVSASGEAISGGTVGTGTRIELVNSFGETTDSLTLVLHGDLDGDGFATVNDYVLLLTLLEDPDGFSAAQLAAADINKNGSVTDNDLKRLANDLLLSGGSVDREPDKGFLAALSVPEIFFPGDTVNVMLAAYRMDENETHTDAVFAEIVFDPSQLTLSGVYPMTCDIEYDVSDAKDGRVRVLSYNKTGSGNVFAQLVFVINEELEDGTPVGIRMENAAVSLDGRCLVSVDRGYSRNIKYPSEEDAFMLYFDNTDVDFDPSITEYEVILPADEESFEIRAEYAKGESVYIGNTEIELGRRRTISVLYTDADGNITVYSFSVWRRSEQQTDSSLSGIYANGSLIEGFDGGVYEYTFGVGEDTEMLSLSAEPSSDESTVSISGPAALVFGENVYVITVTAADGSKTVYTVTVVRERTHEDSSAGDGSRDPSEPEQTEGESGQSAGGPDTSGDGLPLYFLPVFSAVVLLSAAAVWVFLYMRRRKNTQ